MTVAETGIVDWLGIEKTGHIGLTVIDDLDWSDERGHVLLLQEKLNRYLACIESGEVFQHLEKMGARVAAGTTINVTILAKFALSDKAIAFLRHATHTFASIGVVLSHRVVRARDEAEP